MGKGTSETSQQSQATTNPWAPTIGPLQQLVGGVLGPAINNTGPTGAEGGAFNQLSANAAQGNPYAAGVGNITNTLLNGGGPDRTGMVQGAYNTLQGQLSPYATMDTNPYSNEAFNKVATNVTNDVTDRIKGQYAAMGYSPVMSGDFGKALGEGVARGVAPTYLQAYNDLSNQKLGAIGGLYNAGNTSGGILSGLDQTKLANQQAGAAMSPFALESQNYGPQQTLAIEAAKRGLPIQNAGQIASILGSIAGLGGQQTGVQTGTQTMSPAQQAWGWINSFAKLGSMSNPFAGAGVPGGGGGGKIP